jgi:hypothetical protein
MDVADYIMYTPKKLELDQVPVVYACNPSHLGGKDQEDYGSKLA